MGLMLDMIYAVGLTATSPLWATRLIRTGKWRTDWPARLGRTLPDLPDSPNQQGPRVLIHAVSVGEINAIASMVQQLDQQLSPSQVMISATTDTGLARGRSRYAPDHPVMRFPLDFSGAVGRFLDATRPDVVALTELEVWPNFLAACAKRHIPVCVVNGRLSQRSFKGYRKIRPVLGRTFASLSGVAAQNRDYADRFIAMGVPADRVQVTGSMKWDAAVITDDVPGSDELARALGIDRSRPIITAGSTGPGEEAMLLASKPPGVQLLLVPRKPERFDEVAQLSPGMIRRSQHPDGSTPPEHRSDVFLIDTMGELAKAYALAQVALVGRSFLGMFGSNILEPVALGVPSIIGPHHSDFTDLVNALADDGAIDITDQPMSVAQGLLDSELRRQGMIQRGRQTIANHQGASQQCVQMISALALPR